MKKRKIIAVMATLLSVAVIATACKSSTEETKKKSKKDKDDEDIEDVIDDDDDDDDDEETKKTKKTKKTTTSEEETTTTEEPTTTTEEPTTTTTEETTTTTTTQATDSTTADLGDRTAYNEGIYSYTFSNEWQAMAKNGYQYFFKDKSQAQSTFMMIYHQHMTSASQLEAYGYEAVLTEYNSGIVSGFGNGKVESVDMHLDGDKDCYEDIVVSGEYSGKPVELPIRVILDKVNGDCYVFAMYISKDLSAAEKDEVMAKYNECIASITRVG